jgi:hypothetical protein
VSTYTRNRIQHDVVKALESRNHKWNVYSSRVPQHRSRYDVNIANRSQIGEKYHASELKNWYKDEVNVLVANQKINK